MSLIWVDIPIMLQEAQCLKLVADDGSKFSSYNWRLGRMFICFSFPSPSILSQDYSHLRKSLVQLVPAPLDPTHQWQCWVRRIQDCWFRPTDGRCGDLFLSHLQQDCVKTLAQATIQHLDFQR